MNTFEETTVPRDALISHTIALAYETNDEWDYITPPRWKPFPENFNLNEASHSIDVDILDDVTIVVSGELQTSYSVKTRSATYNPPGKAHPAEYENIECEGVFEITLVLEDIGYVDEVVIEIWEM